LAAIGIIGYGIAVYFICQTGYTYLIWLMYFMPDKKDISNEKLLKISELRYRRLFETAQDGVLLIDFMTGMILDANQFLIDLLGYSKSDFLKKYLWEVGAFKDIAASKDNFKILQQKRYVRFEDLPLETKNGNKIEVEFVANAYEVADATIIQCNIRDITDRKKLEEEIRAKSQYSRILIETSIDPFVTISKNGLILDVNSATEKITGLPREKLIGTDFSNYFTEPKKARAGYKQVFKKGQVVNYPLSMLSASGDNTSVIYNASVYRDHEGKVLGVFAAARDISLQETALNNLHKSDNLNAATMAALDDGLWDWNVINGNAFFSPIYYKMLGYKDKEFPANYNSWKKLVHPDDINRVEQDLEKSIESGNKFNIDLRMKTKTGKWLWVSTRGKMIESDMKGKAVRMVGTLSDITERKKAEEALKESEDKFRKLFMEAPMGIALVDSLTGHIYEVNPMFAKIAGRTMEEMVQIDWMTITHPDDLQEDIENMALFNAGKIDGFHMEKRYLHNDGSAVWINMTIAKMNVQDKFHPRHLCMIENITERKRVRDLEKKGQELNSAIIKSIPGTFYMLDKKGEYVRWNDYQRDIIIGKPENLVAGTKALDTIHPDDRELIQSKIANVLANGVIETVEGRVLLRGGPDFRWLVMTGERLIIDGEPFLVGIGIDITERKNAEEKLKELDRLKDDFLSVTTHELKTPLIPIKSQAQLLLAGDYGKLNRDQMKAVEMIYRNEENLNILTGEVLDVAKIKSNKFTLVPRKTDLGKIITYVIENLKSLAEEKHITVLFPPFPEIPKIRADEIRIAQVMNNLIGNAIKFTPDNGRIRIGLKYSEKLITVIVKDTGIGIKPENIHKLFTPFFQIDSSLGRKYRGTGLGLAICKGIIEAHGGKVLAESEGEGKGSTFSFSLPAV
jgi:PAS domain S-box-containing protein